MTRRQKIWLAIPAAIIIALLLFDWNWLRVPVQNYITKKTHREFRMTHLGVSLGRYPKVTLEGVHFQNAGWATPAPMADIGKLEFTISLRDLFEHKVVLPRLALSNANITMEELGDGRRNWIFSDPNDKSETVFRISTLSVDKGALHYIHHGLPFDLKIAVNTFDPASAPAATSASADAVNHKFTTRYDFTGQYRDASFGGSAFTGDVLSFQESAIPFPIRGHLDAGTTKLDVDGTIADVVNISAIDTQLHMSGQTLANLYPFLVLPLPATPPYDVKGRLQLKGDRYSMDDLVGQIGSSDIEGKGYYLQRKPRPLLTAELHSKQLNIKDFGPIVGVKTGETGGSARPTQSQTNSREAAAGKEKQTGGNKLIPTGTFEASRIRAIDADVTLDTGKLIGPDALALETFDASLHVHDSVLTLTPLQFGFAGGKVIAKISMDARGKPLKGSADIDFRHINVAKLSPTMPNIAKGAGFIGAQIRLKGEGDSLADLVGSSNGTLGAAISDGQISNLLDAAVGLNGGKAIPLFVTGDKEIPIRCGGVAMDVKNGLATTTLLVLDTEQTRIDGSGTVDLKNEKFDLNFSPKPKHPGILSLRTPIQVYGTFRDANFTLDKKVLAARVLGAVALAAASPVAVLIPLLEPGTGKDTDCAAVLAPVQGSQSQATSKTQALPKPATADHPKAAK